MQVNSIDAAALKKRLGDNNAHSSMFVKSMKARRTNVRASASVGCSKLRATWKARHGYLLGSGRAGSALRVRGWLLTRINRRGRFDSCRAAPALCRRIGDAHVAIGTSALSVAANAYANLLGHWRAGNVKWACAVTFAVAGIWGRIGSTLGKLVDGQIVVLVRAYMIAVGVAMLRPRTPPAIRMSA